MMMYYLGKCGQVKKQGCRIDLCVMHLFLMGKEIFLKLFVLYTTIDRQGLYQDGKEDMYVAK